MKLDASYRQIISIALPIMLGSAAQNIVALTDSVLLYHLSEVDFAAIGFVGVFYLVVSAIGYGFSRGGQIIIARRCGENNKEAVGKTYWAMFYFEFFLATIMFLFLRFGTKHFFAWFADSPIIYEKSLEYVHYRSYSIFFSYLGVAIIALYTGVARTKFIIYDTILLAVSNLLLCYGFIFGAWGLPKLGIGGAGLAATIAESLAFIAFVVYMLFDKEIHKYHIFHPLKWDLELVFQQVKLSLPVVLQSVVGLGSWFVFFSLIENLGERELAITNLVRMVYLCLSIPCWGFSAGINTMVSNFIGQEKENQVMYLIWKTAKLCLVVTLIISLPIVLFPQTFLYPLLGSDETSLIAESQTTLYVLLGILTIFSIGGVYFNGLAGTGATFFGLQMQVFCVLLYLSYIYVVVNWTHGGLAWAWASEIFYWLGMFGFSLWYLKTGKWKHLKV